MKGEIPHYPMSDMHERYPIPAARCRVEEEIRRSRFITTVAHAPSVEAARAFIAGIKAEFEDATHNGWAYLVGPPGSLARIGYSDDGEPHGTAGKPMFTVLQHSGVGDIAAVVTRYYGGAKLGKGGLVRAYSGGVQRALSALPTGEHVPAVERRLVVAYADLTPLQRLLPEFEAELVGQSYAADVVYELRLPADRVDDFEQAVQALSNGRAQITPLQGTP